MATSLVQTGVKFPDNSIQTTAATAASTTYGAVGTYIIATAVNATGRVAPNSTVAGSNLREWTTLFYSGLNQYRAANASAPFSIGGYGGGVLSGTWRSLGTTQQYTLTVSCGTEYFDGAALFVRTA